MTKTLRIGIAGLGTVGTGTFKLLSQNAQLIRQRTNHDIVVTAVSARDQRKNRDINLEGVSWHKDCIELCDHEQVDMIIELIGGSDKDGPAYRLVKKALESGKPVVSANKALIAHHGSELAQIAAQNKVNLYYEAAVAGGIPAVKMLREGLAANQFSRVYGIFNGTCNYILTSMAKSGRSFQDILQEAQHLGYAEAEPSMDVDGWDTAHKLSILTALAFGTKINFDAIKVAGIRAIKPSDLQTAEQLGYTIKLLGLAQRNDDGSIEQRVSPVLVRKTSPIASVDGVYNAVVAEGNYVGTVMAEGAGAGAEATASAVVADIMDYARAIRIETLGMPAESLQEIPAKQEGTQRKLAHYLHLIVTNRPGVMASVTQIMAEHGISIASCTQHAAQAAAPVSLIMTTHPCSSQEIETAIIEINQLDVCLEPCLNLLIEDF